MEILEKIKSKLQEIFNYQSITDFLAEAVIGLILVTVIMFAFYLLWKVVYLISQPIFKRSKLDATSTIFVNSMIKYGILILGLIQAMDAIGIKTSAVLASLGIVGLTIGFAARDSLSNLISGLLIFLDRPFVIGDIVEIDGFYGRVDRITLRSTRIVTVDGKMLAVPNVDVLNKTVTSYTNFPNIRVDIEVTIGVDQDIGKARRILLSLVSDPKIYMTDPQPRVVVKALNDYNVLLELQVWIENEREHQNQRLQLREAIFNALNEADIDMPFQTIKVLSTSG